jgi:hypothetical protein
VSQHLAAYVDLHFQFKIVANRSHRRFYSSGPVCVVRQLTCPTATQVLACATGWCSSARDQRAGRCVSLASTQSVRCPSVRASRTQASGPHRMFREGDRLAREQRLELRRSGHDPAPALVTIGVSITCAAESSTRVSVDDRHCLRVDRSVEGHPRTALGAGTSRSRPNSATRCVRGSLAGGAAASKMPWEGVHDLLHASAAGKLSWSLAAQRAVT